MSHANDPVNYFDPTGHDAMQDEIDALVSHWSGPGASLGAEINKIKDKYSGGGGNSSPPPKIFYKGNEVTILNYDELSAAKKKAIANSISRNKNGVSSTDVMLMEIKAKGGIIGDYIDAISGNTAINFGLKADMSNAVYNLNGGVIGYNPYGNGYVDMTGYDPESGTVDASKIPKATGGKQAHSPIISSGSSGYARMRYAQYGVANKISRDDVVKNVARTNNVDLAVAGAMVDADLKNNNNKYGTFDLYTPELRDTLGLGTGNIADVKGGGVDDLTCAKLENVYEHYDEKKSSVNETDLPELVMLKYIVEKNGGKVIYDPTTDIVTAKMPGFEDRLLKYDKNRNNIIVTMKSSEGDIWEWRIAGKMINDRMVVTPTFFIENYGITDTKKLTHLEGDLFNSSDDAALAFGLMYNIKSIYIDEAEYFAYIYRYSNHDGEKYSFGNVTIGGGSSVNPPTPDPNKTLYAWVHTHSFPMNDTDEYFTGKFYSEIYQKYIGDGMVSEQLKVDAYLITPSGVLKRMDHNNKDITKKEFLDDDNKAVTVIDGGIPY